MGEKNGMHKWERDRYEGIRVYKALIAWIGVASKIHATGCRSLGYELD
jgi:hypothetical protein